LQTKPRIADQIVKKHRECADEKDSWIRRANDATAQSAETNDADCVAYIRKKNNGGAAVAAPP